MNSFLRSVPFQNMLPPKAQNILGIIQQVNQIKQNPGQLANLLQQRGMINQQQVKDIQQMGANYEQIGHYLMQNGMMPSNIQSYEGQVNQVQSYMK